MSINKLKEKLQGVIEKPLKRMTVDSCVREERFNICKKCDKFIEITSTCKLCGCFMVAKTWLPNASCPLGKWSNIVNEIH